MATTTERSKASDSGYHEPGSIPVSVLLVGFFALPTRKSALTGKEHSRSCGYTPKKAATLGMMYQRVKRQETFSSVHKCPHARALTYSPKIHEELELNDARRRPRSHIFMFSSNGTDRAPHFEVLGVNHRRLPTSSAVY